MFCHISFAALTLSLSFTCSFLPSTQIFSIFFPAIVYLSSDSESLPFFKSVLYVSLTAPHFLVNRLFISSPHCEPLISISTSLTLELALNDFRILLGIKTLHVCVCVCYMNLHLWVQINDERIPPSVRTECMWYMSDSATPRIMTRRCLLRLCGLCGVLPHICHQTHMHVHTHT